MGPSPYCWLSLSLPSGSMNKKKAAMMAEVEVMQGTDNIGFSSPRLTWL